MDGMNINNTADLLSNPAPNRGLTYLWHLATNALDSLVYKEIICQESAQAVEH